MAEDLGDAVLELRTDDAKLKKGIRAGRRSAQKLDKDFAKAARNIGASLDRAGRRISALGERAQRVGKSLTTRLTLPITLLGVGAVKAFADFDQAMTQSIAIMGKVSDVMRNKMGAAAEQVARTTTFNAKQAAESYFFLASAGLNAAQSVAALPQVASFAQAGMFDMAKATDLATDAQSALGLTVSDAGKNLRNLTRVTDVLVKANTLANASVEQFSTALTREAGAALKTFNIDVEEGVAVLAAFADQGVKAELAGTGLSRILRLMTAGATKNADAMQRLGIRVFDSEGKIRNLADIIENLEVALSGMSDEQRTVALESIGFTARVQGMILPLLGTSGAIREYESELRDAGGTTNEVANNQLEAFSAQMKITMDNIMLAAKALGEVMAPAVMKVSGLIRNAAINIQNMSAESRKMIVVVGGILATMGPALIALGIFVKLVGFGTTALGGMVGSVGRLVGAMFRVLSVTRLVSVALGIFNVLALPITGTIALIAAGLFLAFVAWRKFSGGIMALAQPTIDFLSALGEKVKEMAFGFITFTKQFASSIADTLSSFAKFLADVFAVPVEVIGKVMGEIPDMIANTFDTVLGIIADAVGGIAKLFNAIPGLPDIDIEALKATIKGLPSILAEGAQNVSDVAFGMGESVALRFQEGQQAARDAGVDTSLFGFLPSPQELFDRVTGLIPNIFEGSAALAQAQQEGFESAQETDETGEVKEPIDYLLPKPFQLLERFGSLQHVAVGGFTALENIAGDAFKNMNLTAIQSWDLQKITASEAMGSIINTLAQGSKTFFKIQKVAAIGQATVSVLLGIARSLRLGWPQGAIAAAKVAAQGFATISKIRGTSFGGGGSTSVPSAGGGNVNAAVSGSTGPGSIQQDKPSGGGTLLISLDSPGRSRFTRDEIESIFEGVNEKLRQGFEFERVQMQE